MLVLFKQINKHANNNNYLLNAKESPIFKNITFYIPLIQYQLTEEN